MPFHSKNTIGNYRLGATIGEGSYGKVKRAIHTKTNERVAIKIIEKKLVSKKSMEKIAREINILKRLQHPHVVRLEETLETANRVYLVMEYISGGELFDYIVAHHRLREPEARKFFQQIVLAVDYCHKQNVIHRDLKPENLLLDENHRIKVIDFGLSAIFHPYDALTSKCGSPHYTAPEVTARDGYGPKADIFSIGVILFALLCGHLPFDNPNHAVIAKCIREERYVIPDHVSPLARDFIVRMIRADPKRRYGMSEVKKHPWLGLSETQLKSVLPKPQKFRQMDPFPPLPDQVVSAVDKMVERGREQRRRKSLNLALATASDEVLAATGSRGRPDLDSEFPHAPRHVKVPSKLVPLQAVAAGSKMLGAKQVPSPAQTDLSAPASPPQQSVSQLVVFPQPQGPNTERLARRTPPLAGDTESFEHTKGITQPPQPLLGLPDAVSSQDASPPVAGASSPPLASVQSPLLPMRVSGQPKQVPTTSKIKQDTSSGPSLHSNGLTEPSSPPNICTVSETPSRPIRSEPNLPKHDSSNSILSPLPRAPESFFSLPKPFSESTSSGSVVSSLDDFSMSIDDGSEVGSCCPFCCTCETEGLETAEQNNRSTSKISGLISPTEPEDPDVVVPDGCDSHKSGVQMGERQMVTDVLTSSVPNISGAVDVGPARHTTVDTTSSGHSAVALHTLRADGRRQSMPHVGRREPAIGIGEQELRRYRELQHRKKVCRRSSTSCPRHSHLRHRAAANQPCPFHGNTPSEVSSALQSRVGSLKLADTDLRMSIAAPAPMSPVGSPVKAHHFARAKRVTSEGLLVNSRPRQIILGVATLPDIPEEDETHPGVAANATSSSVPIPIPSAGHLKKGAQSIASQSSVGSPPRIASSLPASSAAENSFVPGSPSCRPERTESLNFPPARPATRSKGILGRIFPRESANGRTEGKRPSPGTSSVSTASSAVGMPPASPPARLRSGSLASHRLPNAGPRSSSSNQQLVEKRRLGSWVDLFRGSHGRGRDGERRAAVPKAKEGKRQEEAKRKQQTTSPTSSSDESKYSIPKTALWKPGHSRAFPTSGLSSLSAIDIVSDIERVLRLFDISYKKRNDFEFKCRAGSSAMSRLSYTSTSAAALDMGVSGVSMVVGQGAAVGSGTPSLKAQPPKANNDVAAAFSAMKRAGGGGAIRFSLEVFRLPHLQEMHVVVFGRQTGDTWVHKDLCQALLAELNI